MLRRHYQESIPQDIHLLSRLSRKVSTLCVLVDGIVIGLKDPPGHHPGQRLVSLSSLPDPQIKLSSHRFDQRPHGKIISSQNVLSGQDYACTTGNLRAWSALERYGCRNHSQRRFLGSNTGKNILSHWQLPHNTTQNAFCERLSPLGFKLYPTLVVDFLHEFKLGILKSVMKHLLRIIYAVDPRNIDVLNER